MTALSGEDSPVYIRLRSGIAAGILRGDYRVGDQLPSVRALAAEHGANPLTVAKAYQTFQEEGLVVVRRGVGMFVVADAAARLRRSARERFLAEEWPEIVTRLRRLDIDPADLLERVSG